MKKSAIGTRGCATCAWGVKWIRSDLDGRLHGRCQYVPSIHLPECYHKQSFGEETPMPTTCPGWKRAKDVNLVPLWKEEWIEHLDRAVSYLEKKKDVFKLEFEAHKVRVIAEDPEMAAQLGFV